MSLSDKECRHGVHAFNSAGCYNCVIEENCSLRQSLKEAEDRATVLTGEVRQLEADKHWLNTVRIPALEHEERVLSGAVEIAYRRVEEAEAKIKELAVKLADLSDVGQRNTEYCRMLNEALGKLAQAESTIAQMAEALRFYGNHDNYGLTERDMAINSSLPIMLDIGRKASRALALPLVVSILERQRGKK